MNVFCVKKEYWCGEDPPGSSGEVGVDAVGTALSATASTAITTSRLNILQDITTSSLHPNYIIYTKIITEKFPEYSRELK
jgi:hypothetical protein